MATTAGQMVVPLILLVIWTSQSLAGNILLVSTNSLASPSHYMALSTVTGGLVTNGHNVTLLTNDLKKTTGFPNGTYSHVVYFKATYSQESADKNMTKALEMAFADVGATEMMTHLLEIFGILHQSCQDLWDDTRLVKDLKKNYKFDMVLVFPFSPCGVLMAYYLQTPFAAVTPSIRSPTFHEGFIGMPCPSSYVPFNVLGTFTDEMTFFERMKNLITPLIWDLVQGFANSQYFGIQEEFNIHPDKSIKELYSKASLFLSHVSLSSDFPRPYTPNFVPMGGLIAHPSKPLSKELNEFIEGSGEDGVIIFTLGSVVKGLEDAGMTETFAEVFKKLPQRVLWRHNAKPPSNLGDNTKLTTWLPQNDLLGNPKTRLLIYHGGSNGVAEAIYHGVPMVIIPLFGDQGAHAARVQKKGMGLSLDKNNITEDSLMATIKEVIDNPSYKERAQFFSDVQRDDPMTPLERAVYWIEHVIKFGDAHLRPRSADMGVIELYQIDVIAFLVVVLLLTIYIDYVIIRKCYRVCCSRSNSKEKSE